MRTIILALLALLCTPVAAHAGGLKPGQPAPNATFVTVTGEKFDLASLRGKVVVINFWATWCVPCRKELPLLDAYYRAQREHGLVVLAATTEDSVPEYQLHKLFSAMAITPLRRIRGTYAPLEGVPTNYVIDRNGVLQYAKAGAFDLDDLNALLAPLLAQPETPAGAATLSR